MAISAKATQDFVPIKEIREGVLIMKDGSYKILLMASSLNFSLKSEEEQNAILFQFQNFLNSLDFSVQFYIQSRKLDIEPYLSTLREAEEKQNSELLRIQTREYIEFVKNFVKTTQIVSKTFYVIVPYSGSAKIDVSKKRILSSLPFFSKKSEQTKEKRDDRFEECKLQLQQRSDVISQGLIRAGIRTVPLNTQELIELFYKLFNPGEIEKNIIKDFTAKQGEPVTG